MRTISQIELGDQTGEQYSRSGIIYVLNANTSACPLQCEKLLRKRKSRCLALPIKTSMWLTKFSLELNNTPRSLTSLSRTRATPDKPEQMSRLIARLVKSIQLHFSTESGSCQASDHLTIQSIKILKTIKTSIR